MADKDNNRHKPRRNKEQDRSTLFHFFGPLSLSLHYTTRLDYFRVRLHKPFPASEKRPGKHETTAHPAVKLPSCSFNNKLNLIYACAHPMLAIFSNHCEIYIPNYKVDLPLELSLNHTFQPPPPSPSHKLLQPKHLTASPSLITQNGTPFISRKRPQQSRPGPMRLSRPCRPVPTCITAPLPKAGNKTSSSSVLFSAHIVDFLIRGFLNSGAGLPM